MKQVLLGVAAASVVIGATMPSAMAMAFKPMGNTQEPIFKQGPTFEKAPLVVANASTTLSDMMPKSESKKLKLPVKASTTTTSSTWSQVEISVGGQELSSPQAFHEGGETFLPISDIDAALQKIGEQVTWNSSTYTWNLQASSSVLEALAQTPGGGDVGTGNTSATVNGILLAKIDTVNEIAPNTGTEETYVPLNFVQDVFGELGAGVWNASSQQLDINTPNYIISAIATNGSIVLTFANPFVVAPGTSELAVTDTRGATIWATWSPTQVSDIQLGASGATTVTLTVPKTPSGVPSPRYSVSYMGEAPVQVLAN